MSTLLEDPTPFIVLGIFAEAVLGVMLVRTGRGVLLAAMLGVLLLVLAGVALEWLAVTEVERVEATLKGAAAAMEANDEDALLAYCSSSESAAYTRSRAQQALRSAEITRIKLNALKITINRLTSPPTAEARFVAVVSAQGHRDTFGHMTRPVRLSVELCCESGRWLIIGHEWEDGPGRF